MPTHSILDPIARWLLTLACLATGSIASAGTTPTPAPTVSIFASPATVTVGEFSRITWSSTHATSCRASGGDWTGEKPLSDSKNTGLLTATVSFRLTCTGPGGSATGQTTVVVTKPAPPIVSVTATPKTISNGSHTLISWSARNATSCTAAGDWTGSKPLEGAKNTGALTTDEVFALTCTGPGGIASQSATVTVLPATYAATLSWSPPKVNTNGTPVVPLSGFHIYYGKSAAALTKSVIVRGGKTTSVEISGLPAGTWYFSVAADAENGTQGPLSELGSITL